MSRDELLLQLYNALAKVENEKLEHQADLFKLESKKKLLQESLKDIMNSKCPLLKEKLNG